jgi:hypothetical protein
MPGPAVVTLATFVPFASAFFLFLSPACDKKTDDATATAASPTLLGSGGTARVTVGEHGFAPSALAVPKGAAGSTGAITFVRTTDATCAKEVVFPDLQIKKDLPLNVPVTIDVPTDAERTLTFQCGMAMYKGSLVVKPVP